MYLTPADLTLLSLHYIHKGLLFVKPQQAYDNPVPFMASFLETLKNSLSLALVHFYPLAGRLKTLKRSDPHLYTIYVDSGETSPRSRFIYATLEATISDILTLLYVPAVVKLFFDHDRAVNHDGHTMPLLSIQVTKLVDGVFIGCSMNHCIGDGTSIWNFLISWSEIQACGGGGYSDVISRPPVLQRWFPDGSEIPVNLPFNDPVEFVAPFEAPVLLERVFHFSSETVSQLKAKVNGECKTDKISSFQALSALVWRAITRARRLPADQVTSCWMAANNRLRMNPPLSPDYFGVSSSALTAGTTTVGELLHQELGWVAWKLHQGVAGHTDEKLRHSEKEWRKRPMIFCPGRQSYDPNSILMGSSPRFNKYGPEFGLGRAVALRSGYANKFDGKVSGYPGREGGGSVDFEMCLLPEFMAAITVYK